MNIECQKFCKVCKSPLNKGNVYCSAKCRSNDPELRNKIRQKLLQKYGVDNVSKISEIKKKKIETTRKNYGVDNPNQSNIILKKRKETNLQKYGEEHYFQTEEFKQRTEEKYMREYGVRSHNQLEEVKKKKEETFLKHYGVKTNLQLEGMQELRKEGILKKYDGVYGLQDHMRESLIFLRDENWMRKQYEDLRKSSIQIGEELNVSDTTVREYLHDLKIKIRDWYPTSNTSLERKIIDIIPNGIEYEQNNRKLISPKELDIYFPSYHLAIEVHGILGHSYSRKETTKEKLRHQTKYDLCEEKGIRLLQIFDHEIFDETKMEIWKSIIYNVLNGEKFDKISARNCEIKELHSEEYVEFCRNNHLQGPARSSIRLGLFYRNELVSIMSFGKPRFNKEIDYELIRYCSKKFVRIIGGASKLFSYFETKCKPKSIISYCDNRYGTGKLYNILGFRYKRTTSPNYVYYKKGKVYNRMNFQKHKLKNLLEIYDSAKTESENMFENGYKRIWDAGNKVFIKSL